MMKLSNVAPSISSLGITPFLQPGHFDKHYTRGGARGGLGGYSPRRKVKSDFFGVFGI